MRKSAALRSALERMDAIPGEIVGSLVCRTDARQVHPLPVPTMRPLDEGWDGVRLKKPGWFDADAWEAVCSIMRLPPEAKLGVLRYLRDAYDAPISIHDGEKGNSGLRPRKK